MILNYFSDLVNLNADEWNKLLAYEFNYTVDQLKRTTTTNSFRLVGEKLKVDADKSIINILFNERLIDGEPKPLDSFSVKVSKRDIESQSISLTGKVVIGIDFSNCDLSFGYFCDCIFYNCIFDNTNLEFSTFSSSTFNGCSLKNANLVSCTFGRTKIFDSEFDGSSFEYSVFTDSPIVGSSFIHVNISQSKLIYSGSLDSDFSDSNFVHSDFIDSAFINTTFSRCMFNSSNVMGCIYNACNLMGSSFENSYLSRITTTLCQYDDTVKKVFTDLGASYTQSTNEFADG